MTDSPNFLTVNESRQKFISKKSVSSIDLVLKPPLPTKSTEVNTDSTLNPLKESVPALLLNNLPIVPSSPSPNNSPNRKRNRSRSATSIKRLPLNTLTKVTEVRNRSHTEPNEIPPFKYSPRTKLKDLRNEKQNNALLDLYNKMKSHYDKEFISPFENLIMKFYIKTSEPKNIKIFEQGEYYSRDELLLLYEKNNLYCKLSNLDKFLISELEYGTYSYKRLINISDERYKKGLECVNEDNFDYKDNGAEILAVWDKEKLFDHLTQKNYFLKEKYVRKWPKVKNSEPVDKIKPKELFDKFWKCTITEHLGNLEYLNVIDDENIELIIFSIEYLIEELKNADQVIFLETLLIDLYKKLIIINPDREKYYFECAKYSTILEFYLESWYYIHRCNIASFIKKEDITWLKQLKMYYVSHIMRKNERSDTIAKSYIEIGNFTKIIHDFEDNDNTLEIVDHYLEGLICLYYQNSNLIKEEITKWDSDIIFKLLCSSYSRSSIEENECLFNICYCCIDILNKIQFSCDTNSLSFINETISNNMKALPIIEYLIKLPNDESTLIKLYLKIFNILFENEKIINIKNFYVKYDNDVLINMIIYLISGMNNHKRIIDLSEILIERNYMSNIYLTILAYLNSNEIFIYANSFIKRSIDLIIDLNEEERENILNNVKNNYEKSTKQKFEIYYAFFMVVDTICEQKDCSDIVNNWINVSFILNNYQYMNLCNNRKILKLIKEKYVIDDNMEIKEFVNKLYEHFGLLAPMTNWIPEFFINPIDYANDKKRNSDLRQSNGVALNDKMIEAVKKMNSQGKEADDIAFMFSIPIKTVEKILLT